MLMHQATSIDIPLHILPEWPKHKSNPNDPCQQARMHKCLVSADNSQTPHTEEQIHLPSQPNDSPCLSGSTYLAMEVIPHIAHPMPCSAVWRCQTFTYKCEFSH